MDNTLTYTIRDLSILISEDEKNYGYAGKVWECASVFSSFISSDKARKLFKNKSVIEIGSGTGFCGLVVSQLGAKKVILSDRELNLPILEKNIQINKQNFNGCDVNVFTVDWNYIHEYKRIKEQYDIIIASDIIYQGVNFLSIVNLLDFLSNTSTEILIGYNHRLASGYEFFEILDQQGKWKVKTLDNSSIDDEYRNDSIVILYIKKIVS
jgi:predicted nicotinamide N-methyase